MIKKDSNHGKALKGLPGMQRLIPRSLASLARAQRRIASQEVDVDVEGSKNGAFTSAGSTRHQLAYVTRLITTNKTPGTVSSQKIEIYMIHQTYQSTVNIIYIIGGRCTSFRFPFDSRKPDTRLTLTPYYNTTL